MEVRFTREEQTVIENEDSVDLCVELIGNLDGQVEVEFTTSGSNSATVGVDFRSVQTSLIFSAETSKLMCVTVEIVEDFTLETDENFTAVITSTDPAANVTLGTTQVVIVDSDGKYL